MSKHDILIVDDEENILATMSRLLRSEGRQILLANNVTDALEKLKANCGADLVISDNKMPDMSGIDFLVKVRQLYPHSVRILVTGYPDLEAAINAINKGQVYRFISKPWENEEIKLIVKQALEYCDVLRDNRVLIDIARQQADMLKNFETKHPEINKEEFDKSGLYIIEEKKVSETLEGFLKKYYPK